MSVQRPAVVLLSCVLTSCAMAVSDGGSDHEVRAKVRASLGLVVLAKY